MKAFLLMTAAWLSGAGGTPIPQPGAAPVVSSAPGGACCGANAPAAAPVYVPGAVQTPAPVYAPAPTYVPAPVNGPIVSSTTGNCACDTCGQQAAGVASTAAPAAKSGHLFHRLFGKKPAATTATAAPVATSGCSTCAAATPTPVVGGTCGCESATAGPAATTEAKPGLFQRWFGKKPATSAAPTAVPGCSTCSTCGTSAPVGAVYPTVPGQPVVSGPGCANCAAGHAHPAPVTFPGVGHPAALPSGTLGQGIALPPVGTPIATGTQLPTGTPAPTPGTPTVTPNPMSNPLPTGTPATKPEGVKEAPKEPAKLPPESNLGGDRNVTPASGTRIESEGRNPFDLHHRQQAQRGCAADYSWVTGQLAFVHADGGLWVLRYASLDKEDRHGGSVILSRDRRMEAYREGDIVTVNGNISAERGSTRLSAPLYRIGSIQLVERPSN